MSSHAEEVKKPIYKKWWFWLIIVIIIIAIAGTSGENNTTTNANTVNETQEEQIKSTENKIETGTSAKIDEIAIQAKEDADNMTETIKNEAVSFIQDNREDFYKDNETMEQAMYYGYLLEYAFEDSDKDLAKLGQDVYQSIKYVYRGAESVEDEATQENLRQIEKDLQAID